MDKMRSVKRSVNDAFNYVSEYTVNGLVEAVNKGHLDLDAKQLKDVTILIKQLVNAGYSRSQNTLDRELQGLLG